MTESVTPDSRSLSGVDPTQPVICGRTLEWYQAERAAEERRQAELYSRLQSLLDLTRELDALKESQRHLETQVREFGRELAALRLETTGEVVEAEADGA